MMPAAMDRLKKQQNVEMWSRGALSASPSQQLRTTNVIGVTLTFSLLQQTGQINVPIPYSIPERDTSPHGDLSPIPSCISNLLITRYFPFPSSGSFGQSLCSTHLFGVWSSL